MCEWSQTGETKGLTSIWRSFLFSGSEHHQVSPQTPLSCFLPGGTCRLGTRHEIKYHPSEVIADFFFMYMYTSNSLALCKLHSLQLKLRRQ